MFRGHLKSRVGQLDLEVKGKIPERYPSAESEGCLRASLAKRDEGCNETGGMGGTKTMRAETAWCRRGVKKPQCHGKIKCKARTVRE